MIGKKQKMEQYERRPNVCELAPTLDRMHNWHAYEKTFHSLNQSNNTTTDCSESVSLLRKSSNKITKLSQIKKNDSPLSKLSDNSNKSKLFDNKQATIKSIKSSLSATKPITINDVIGSNNNSERVVRSNISPATKQQATKTTTCSSASSSNSTHQIIQTKTPKPRRRVATVAQRRAANIRERRRMYNLNTAFDKLRKKVPSFAYEKRLSRIETLKLAIMYIKFMDYLVKDDAYAEKYKQLTSSASMAAAASSGYLSSGAYLSLYGHCDLAPTPPASQTAANSSTSSLVSPCHHHHQQQPQPQSQLQPQPQPQSSRATPQNDCQQQSQMAQNNTIHQQLGRDYAVLPQLPPTHGSNFSACDGSRLPSCCSDYNLHECSHAQQQICMPRLY